jgi:hypothetical protein
MVTSSVDVIIATPGSSMDSEYVVSLVKTMNMLNERGISFYYANKYTSRVAAAREATAMDSDFLDAFNNAPMSGNIQYKKMFWIDSDISWEPSDFLHLYKSELDIVSGIYLSDKGVPMFSPLSEKENIKTMVESIEPQEVLGVGFGFVCIKQGIFEAMPRPWFDTKFSLIKDESTGKEMFIPYGEDYSWCVSAKESGFKVHIDPLIKVTHNKKVPIRL